ncbi:MAG: hypothetical protein HY731_11475 [Candidatus Tectomicrobia bacterium]|nr:hypothetical protein [Candidatus Tectomicrobia bacterium]
MSNNETVREILSNLIQTRYGHLLTPEQFDEVKKGVENLLQMADTLSQVKLKNGDEPFSVFIPYRSQR